MTPGSNLPLSVSRVAVDVTAPVRLDVSGLLLDAGGTVRSDDDLVFYNQPVGPGVAHHAASGTTGDTITVDTTALPEAVTRVVVTASLDDPGATFAGTEPTARVRSAEDGSVLATFTPPRLATESALVLMEVYRRGGAWKLRAVGQGYANGLAGIATDFGVTVERPAPSATAPPGVGPDASSGGGVVNLDKGRVSLAKHQTVSLVKGGRPVLSTVRMALGWQPALRGKDIDLDASVIAYGSNGRKLDACFFGKLSILGGAVAHSGDNLTGEGGDDEAITVHLDQLPEEVTGLVFTVNSFSGQNLTEVAEAYCRLVDTGTHEELVRFSLGGGEKRTGVLMCKLIRGAGEWRMTALGEYVDARTVRGMVEPGARVL